MAKQTVTEAEYEVMKVLWREGEPMGLGEIVKSLTEKERSRNTIATLLMRLYEKGAVGIEKKGKANLYYALLKREDYRASETRSFLSRLYNGSVGSLVAALYKNNDISDREMEELRNMLSEENKDE